MKILIACEYSGRVREAFRKRGHDVISCDLLDADDGSPHHYKGDVFDIIEDGFDMMIAHPPCTYLCNSGVCWLHKDESRWAKMEDGAKFMKRLLDADIPKVAIENPIMHKYAKAIVGRTYDFSVQPYEHGEPESKRTCFWTRGLPPITPTNMLEKPESGWNQTLHRLPPSPDRWKLRSTTFQGIANALAEQWG